MNNKITIGLFGFGTVGNGLHEVLHKTPSLEASIKKICIKDNNKQRSINKDYFTTNADELLEDAEINTIVELIDDAGKAFEIVKKALQRGKAVVTANKKMIAAHFEELLQLQQQYKVPLLYEGACCASIPIIRNLEEYYDNDLLSSIRGIINGSTNYILTKINEEGLQFKEALLEAQQLGFAENDPSLDIEGHDAANKLSILIAHAFGCIAIPAEILYSGICHIATQDANLARQKQSNIKLVATAQKLSNGDIAAFVLPQFVNETDELAPVKNEFNAVVTESCFSDKHFFKGKGAGAFPTAAAVLSDISALRYQYKYEYRKLNSNPTSKPSNDFYLKVFVSAQQEEDLAAALFEWVEEKHNEPNYNWLIGVIHAAKLKKDNWWQKPGISLIACNEPLIEDISYRQVNKRSLELAGAA
ncbi:MAG: homoserine dehydrogenase [Ferruginibacter sp.]